MSCRHCSDYVGGDLACDWCGASTIDGLKQAQEMVEDFHRKFGCTIGEFIAVRDPVLRCRLIKEEVIIELLRALIANDVVEVADGIADGIYVLLGTAVACGIDIWPIFREVHWSNMTKTPGNVRGDGKILKGSTFVPPDVRGELIKQGWREKP